MRRQNENPAFDPAYLGASGRYPSKHVEILWNRADNFLVRDVEVALVAPGTEEDRDTWDRYIAWRKHWAGHLGTTDEDWVDPGGMTPTQVFGTLLNSGFVDTLELQVALREFSAIEECAWAREMLEGFPVEEDAPDWA
ncbi:hypothetical protein [uncultured Rhodospira sp.]|uniref:hypothetical protein n=1 Tax=uncultured Rhodospira sp. TaxID=1936189 RepID=UPI002628F7F4|nr:hypothetical protein [uncultured Rhodospira sp.]